jgi:hypothetical protein
MAIYYGSIISVLWDFGLGWKNLKGPRSILKINKGTLDHASIRLSPCLCYTEHFLHCWPQTQESMIIQEHVLTSYVQVAIDPMKLKCTRRCDILALLAPIRFSSCGVRARMFFA